MSIVPPSIIRRPSFTDTSFHRLPSTVRRSPSVVHRPSSTVCRPPSVVRRPSSTAAPSCHF
ncbi:MAG TPA: hypothetical protein ENJ53_00940 [Phaeodactylibacter sp.]|nr:hypothetical protein [Phaeodactylibacter sp.]